MEPGGSRLIELWLQARAKATFANCEIGRAATSASHEQWERVCFEAKASAQFVLDELFSEHLLPAVRSAVARRLPRYSPEYEDTCQEALARVISRLEQLNERINENGIGTMIATTDWPAYARTVALHCVFDRIRKQNRTWHLVRGRLQYLLTRHAKFAIWQEGENELCGLREWRGEAPAVLSRENPRINEILADLSRPWAELVLLVFAEAGAPARFDDLIGLFQRHFQPEGSTYAPRRRNDERDDRSECENLADGAEPPDLQAYLKEVTNRMWQIVLQLPLGQRRALLLNLRGSDGGDIQLVDYLKLASRSDLARCLRIEDSEFEMLWPDLPLDDNTIADMFGVTRQQVINWRSAARERLKNGLDGWREAI